MSLYQQRHSPHFGFTLAEVLIALILLGVIAAFTFPKILQSSQNERYNSIVKEFIANFSEALHAERLENGLNPNTSTAMIMNRLNTLGRNNRGIIDGSPNWPFGNSFDCSDPRFECYTLTNGAIVMHNLQHTFGPLTTGSLGLTIDPDGKASSVKGLTLFFTRSEQIYTSYNAPSNLTFEFQGGTFGQYFFPSDPIPPRTGWLPDYFHW